MNRYTNLFIFIIYMCFHSGLHAQYLEVGGSIGGVSYQGDINLLSSRLSFQGAKFLKGLHIGYHFSDLFSVKIRTSAGSIAASDANSIDSWRRYRNLSFRSSISEIALINELELLDIFPYFQNSNFKPFFSVGVAYFKFNPQANYKGTWVDLQPLSTEGQGLPGNNNQPYKLNQISIPFGIGIRYFLNDEFYVALEIGPRITFTDYLDDLSGSYPDLEILRQFKGDLAPELSFRGDQLPNGIQPPSGNNTARGNSKDKDWYIFNSITFAYKFNPGEELRKRRSFREGRKCSFYN